jgi:hypothetical protein
MQDSVEICFRARARCILPLLPEHHFSSPRTRCILPRLAEEKSAPRALSVYNAHNRRFSARDIARMLEML